MGFIPNIKCERCHRQYPAFRSRCPHCGMKKPQAAPEAVPTTDSVVRDTPAARKAVENMNWQMLIGGILVLCILVAVIVIVSGTVSKHVDDPASSPETPVDPVAATAIPTPTAAPTPSPTPPPVVTSLMIMFAGQEATDFTERVGTEVQLQADTYPLSENVEVTWSSSDDDVATVSDNGLVTITGSGACTITAVAGGIRKECIARGWE